MGRGALIGLPMELPPGDYQSCEWVAGELVFECVYRRLRC
jgi:hypothetical protein